MKSLLSMLAVIALISIPLADADAKKKGYKREDYSKEQQKMFFEKATKLCRAKFGASLHYVRVNYAKNQFYCYHY
jgi:hypothetical protein